jgi:serine/threonine protein kinase
LHGYPVLSSFQRITPFGKKCINKRNNPYCSPEEINNEKIEASSDLWSVGILIYYLIGGKYPSHSFLYDK